MAENSKIEWTDHTFNPWRGCTKVSPGCLHCYAETLSKRNPKTLGIWGDGGVRVVAAESYWRQPLAWDKQALRLGGHHRVFCASLADWLEDRPELDEPRARLLGLIKATPHLDWLLLTKRPQNWRPAVGRAWNVSPSVPGPMIGDLCADWLDGKAPSNVWLGTSVEDQTRANERIPHLLGIPARVRFLSCEPLLGPVDLEPYLAPAWSADADPSGPGLDCPGLDWVIVGGESGPDARPMHLAWVRSIRDQCQAAGVPKFVKQIGSRPIGSWSGLDPIATKRPFGDEPFPLRDPKGGDPDEWPEDLRLREFPQAVAL